MSDEQTILTISAYLYGCVNFPITEEAMLCILSDRDVLMDTPVTELEAKTRDLLKADVMKWVCLSPNKSGSISDSDNGWSHSEGGYTLTSSDKTLLMNEANAIYEKYEEATFGKTRVKVTSWGIKPADIDIDGRPACRSVNT